MITFRFKASFYGTRINGTVEAENETQAKEAASQKFQELFGISPARIEVIREG
jgi:hypothetical protein